MSPLWAVLTTAALALVLTGWLPRLIRPAATIVTAAAVAVSGVVAVSVLGPQHPLQLILLGAVVGLFSPGWHQVPGSNSGLVRRLGQKALAVGVTVTGAALVSAGAADAVPYPVLCLPAPVELTATIPTLFRN